MNSAAEWYSEQEYRERCGMPHEGESMPKQKISNADRIRSMTDEELAAMLCRDRCSMCAGASNEHCGESWFCAAGMLAWLEQEEAENDAL